MGRSHFIPIDHETRSRGNIASIAPEPRPVLWNVEVVQTARIAGRHTRSFCQIRRFIPADRLRDHSRNADFSLRTGMG